MYDESKKPTETVDATFRKLNVDWLVISTQGREGIYVLGIGEGN